MPWPPSPRLPQSPFPSPALAVLDAVAGGLLAPGWWALDGLLALRPTTAQRARWGRGWGARCCGVGARVLAGLALVPALLLSLPLGALGLLLWLPVQATRRPFVLQHDAGTAAAPPWDPRHRRSFTFLSANLCLLPSGLAGFSNLARTRHRARRIARLLAPGTPEGPAGDRLGLLEPRHGEPKGYGGTLGTARSWHGTGSDTAWEVPLEDAGMDPAAGLEMPADNPSLTENATPWLEMPVVSPAPMASPVPIASPVPMSSLSPMSSPAPMASPAPADAPVPTLAVPMSSPAPGPTPAPQSPPVPGMPVSAPAAPSVLSEHIPPDTDFVCLQEVFDGAAAAVLRRRLGRRFPFVLWGVGPGGLRRRRLRVLGSGLVLGSRFPLLAARFQPFPNAAREDALANKGLLLAQVLLGSARGRRLVGFIGCTHLQAPACDATIRDVQLTLVLRWLREFRQEQEQCGDLVAFDVLCGDLNFDNCSRGDVLNQQHRLFEEYQDPCRRGPGQDQPWAIGTLLNYLKIYEEPVSTPKKMKRTLSQPWGRQQYLAGPILCNGDPDPAAPRPWQGRRVDYVLHRQCPPLPTEVTEVSVITQLATCSDHLPVALRLRVGPAGP